LHRQQQHRLLLVLLLLLLPRWAGNTQLLQQHCELIQAQVAVSV
jgi:hypothetical protein